MLETINEQLKNHFYHHPEIAPLLEEIKRKLQHNQISPFAAATQLLSSYFK